MKDLKIKFPLYLGVFFLLISVLTVSVKVGERTMVQNGLINASLNKANVTLLFTEPDIVSINVVSTYEVSGGDFVVKYDSDILEILPSTLSGLSGYVVTGGNKINNNSFLFSVINNENPIKNGFLVTFRIQPKIPDHSLNNNLSINFDSGTSQIIDLNGKAIQADFIGIN